MSRIRANNFTDKAGTGAPTFPHGAVVTGVVTATSFSGTLSGNVTGNVTGNVAGNVTGAGINVTGVVTATSFVGDGSALTGIDATALKDTNGSVVIQAEESGAIITGVVTATSFSGAGINVTGVVTATSFSGDGSALTGIDATALKDSDGNVKIQAESSGVVISGVTTTTDINFDGKITQTVQTAASSTIDCSVGNYFTLTVNGATTVSFTNVPSSGTSYSCVIEVLHTSGTISWHSSIKWPNDSAPSITTGKTHLFIFVTDNGGTRWRGAAQVNYTT